MSESSWETLNQVIDLAGALQWSVGMALLLLVELVGGSTTGRLLLILAFALLGLMTALVVTDRAPPTGLLWSVGVGMFGTAIGVSLLAYALGISASGTEAYLAAATLVAVGYALHRPLKTLARSALPEFS